MLTNLVGLIGIEPVDYGESRNMYFAAFPQTIFFVTQALVEGC